ncbi:MAG TPA: helix-hairpin-helix domain-containing protein [Firmicutes bacterium]|nr:helix-hairpin-helix domain-containing protein [Bacillota bacterium]
MVPAAPATTTTPAGASSTSAGGDRISLNQAGIAELVALPGIGPELARRIVEYRETHGPFTSVDELQNVPGIGPAKLGELRGRVTLP